MKIPQIILVLLCITTPLAFGATFVPPAAVTVSDDVLLSAIADVETGNNAAKRGHHGERTQLQIMPATWYQFSRLPHSASASNPDETDRVARAYLGVIRRRLHARGLPETPFFIAASWNAGPGWKKLRSSTVSYADRVSNVVDALLKESAEPVTKPELTLPVSRAMNRGMVFAARMDNIPVIGISGAN